MSVNKSNELVESYVSSFVKDVHHPKMLRPVDALEHTINLWGASRVMTYSPFGPISVLFHKTNSSVFCNFVFIKTQPKSETSIQVSTLSSILINDELCQYKVSSEEITRLPSMLKCARTPASSSPKDTSDRQDTVPFTSQNFFPPGTSSSPGIILVF